MMNKIHKLGQPWKNEDSKLPKSEMKERMLLPTLQK